MGCRLGRPRRGRSAEQGEERETELLETLDKEQRILEGRHEEAGQVLQTTYEREKGALTYSFQESKALLQDTNVKLSSSREPMQARMNGVEGSLLSRVYERHIQDHGSPGPFWEQELESLHHVIELKNERIHELERQLLLVDMLVGAEATFLAFPPSSVCGKLQLGARQHGSATCTGGWSGSDGGSLSLEPVFSLAPLITVTWAALGPVTWLIGRAAAVTLRTGAKERERKKSDIGVEKHHPEAGDRGPPLPSWEPGRHVKAVLERCASGPRKGVTGRPPLQQTEEPLNDWVVGTSDHHLPPPTALC